MIALKSVFTIERGATNNRVREQKPPRAKRQIKSKRIKHTENVIKVCYSMPAFRADQITEWAERCGMSASAFVAEAARQMAVAFKIYSGCP